MTCNRCEDYEEDQHYIKQLEYWNRIMREALEFIVEVSHVSNNLDLANSWIEIHKEEALGALGELDD